MSDGDDDLEVEPTDFSDDFLESEAEIRIRGQRIALASLVALVRTGAEAYRSIDNVSTKTMALWGTEFVNQCYEQGWDPKTIREKRDERYVSVEKDEILDMLDAEIMEVDDGT